MSGATENAKRPRILVVDDEENIRCLLRDVLDSADITECADGSEALECLRQQPFDIIITDLQMPHLDGYAVIDTVRRMPEDKKPYLIVISGSIDMVEKKRLLAMGVNTVLAKPFGVTELKHLCSTLPQFNRQE